MIKTAGTWDRQDWPTYFVAASLGALEWARPTITNMLVAVNELHEQKDIDRVASFVDEGKAVLVDSGVFWLSTQHAQKHGVTMDIALGMAPTEVDGFEELYANYVKLNTGFGDRCWGYIEIDQGGRENKMRTRAKLEALGLRPIPVYHPLNDGWDYFDHLAQNYDRICFGNVVNADMSVRKRLVATAWERRRKYPHLWIHLLGMTPSEITMAFPSNSCDSSTWISGVRWGAHSTTISSQRMPLDDGFVYDRAHAMTGERGYHKAAMMCGYDAFMTKRTMQRVAADQKKELGADIGLFVKQ